MKKLRGWKFSGGKLSYRIISGVEYLDIVSYVEFYQWTDCSKCDVMLPPYSSREHNIQMQHMHTRTPTSTSRQWPEQSKPHTSQLGERPHTIILQQRLHKSKLDTRGAWRNPIVTALGPSPFMRSVNTRKTQTFWSGRHPSSVLSKRLLTNWSRICKCRALPFLPSMRLWKHTLFASLKTHWVCNPCKECDNHAKRHSASATHPRWKKVMAAVEWRWRAADL